MQYLCSIFTEDGKNKEDKIQGIKKAKVIFNNKKELLCSNTLSLEIKKETYKTLYLECSSLWIETWTLGKKLREGRKCI